MFVVLWSVQLLYMAFGAEGIVLMLLRRLNGRKICIVPNGTVKVVFFGILLRLLISIIGTAELKNQPRYYRR